MFVDEVTLMVKSGKGGDGIIGWRREKYVPMGGPYGGDGGKGGSVIFRADEGLSTLLDLRYQKRIIADAGDNGGSKNMTGADGADVIIPVPVGTIVYDEETNAILCDLTKHNQESIIAKGGKGGRGNTHFATSRNQAPYIQENGEPGITRNLRIELRLLADVGLIGFPSVGKSTLISVVSGSKPKIADYPFTTLVPNLGVVDVEGIRSFVMADMPGIIKGASQGVGLGLQFLRHIERTRVIVHIIDISEASGRDPYDDYLTINHELAEYRYQLSQRPQIIVANKMDTPKADERLKELQSQMGNEIKIIPISALTKTGLKPLLHAIIDLLNKTPLFNIYEDSEIPDEVLYDFNPADPGFTVRQLSEHVFEAFGPRITRMFQKTRFGNEESIKHLARCLRQMGVDDELRKINIKNGDTVRIVDYEFEFID
ncbi:MAG: GTPase ObgE [Candidatus Izemoplasmatales bacterium]|jgi:GTP-binding protein|nr:GTPase ObgE [Candidatus Izemoplasmatales bacterium]MDD4595505.1 GTPase ObgE [Candidatus Izemoplasmatales bacterium]